MGEQTSDSPDGGTALNYFADGTCKVCNSTNTQESVSCLRCDKLFHMINCAGSESNDCLTSSAFTQHFQKAINKTGKYANRPGNFCFVCDPCMTQLELNKTCTTNDKVQMLDLKVSKLTQDIGDIKKLLTEKSTAPETTQLANVATSAPGVNGNVWCNTEQVNKIKSLLVIDKNANCDLNDSAIINKCSAQVHSKYPDKNGNTVVVCESPESRDALKQHFLNTGIDADKLSEPKPRYPTISIVGFPSEMGEVELRANIMVKNSKLAGVCTNKNAVFDIVSVKSVKRNSSVFQAFVRVSDDVRTVIKSYGDKLFFGWEKLAVYDQLYIRRCNKCQGYNHYARECKNSQCCGLCASSDHQYRDCLHKDKASTDRAAFYCCTNCKTAGKTDFAHPAYSSECSMYRYEQTLLKKSLATVSKNW